MASIGCQGAGQDFAWFLADRDRATAARSGIWGCARASLASLAGRRATDRTRDARRDRA
ncbi:MAG: hypothetical protein M0014_05615 [Actinomycetota bacterium]|nr:hypothetical protein [Actinomycetota bacterium]